MKTVLIQVRVSEEEKREIKKQSERENFSTVSEFLRKIALDRIQEVKR